MNDNEVDKILLSDTNQTTISRLIIKESLNRNLNNNISIFL